MKDELWQSLVRFAKPTARFNRHDRDTKPTPTCLGNFGINFIESLLISLCIFHPNYISYGVEGIDNDVVIVREVLERSPYSLGKMLGGKE